ncbi:MAG: MalY/PatB family protein [Spirochaetota bacterium]
MGRYDFDTELDRTHSESVKWDRDAIERIAGNSEAVPFWVADMDFASPPEVIEALKQRVTHGIFGYPSKKAVTDALLAFCQWTEAQHAWQVPPEEVLYTPGLISTLSIFVTLLTHPGEGVVIQTPAYRPFFSIITDNQRNCLENPLLYDDVEHRYTFDFPHLENLLARRDTTLLLLCSPHNPAGRVWTSQELQRVYELCASYEVAVVSDEIHADLCFDGHVHTPFSSLQTGSANQPATVTCMAPSKTFNIAGEHFSCAVVPDPELRERLNRELSRLSISSPGILAATAAEAAYRHGAQWLGELKAYLQENARLIDEVFSTQIPQLSLVRPEASFIAFIDCRELLPLLSQAGYTGTLAGFFGQYADTALHDGRWFGRDGRGFVRINFGTPRENLKRALEKIGDAVERLPER